MEKKPKKTEQNMWRKIASGTLYVHFKNYMNIEQIITEE